MDLLKEVTLKQLSIVLSGLGLACLIGSEVAHRTLPYSYGGDGNIRKIWLELTGRDAVMDF